MAEFIYFMRASAGGGSVKIGYSWKPEDRLAFCQPFSPVTLVIVATMPGGPELERRLHLKFKAQHSHGEWFHPSAELECMILDVVAGKFDAETLPGGSWIPRRTRKGVGWSEATRAKFLATMAARRSQKAAA